MSDKKQAYFAKLLSLLREYPRCLVVGADNVGSSQLQKIRHSLRGEGVVLMGKNTMIRKAMRSNFDKMPQLNVLYPHVRGNIGFIFTKGELSKIKKKILEMRVQAPAKAGSVAPCDVIIPAGNTGLEPTQTSFLQALNIASKIVRGNIEIISDVHLLKPGDKVLPGHAALLQKLNILPFNYALQPRVVYDSGSVFHPSLLDITQEDIIEKLIAGVKNVVSLSRATNQPNAATAGSMLTNGFMNMLAVAFATSYTFPRADKFKQAAAAAPAPSASVSAAAAAAAAATPAPAAAAKKDDGKKGADKAPAEKKKPEPTPAAEPEEDDPGMGGLFD